MKKIIIIILLVAGSGYKALWAGELYFELGAGANTSFNSAVEWEDGDGVGAYFSFRYETDIKIFKYSVPSVWHLSHLSQWDIGSPSNDKKESSVYHLGYAFRWKIM